MIPRVDKPPRPDRKYRLRPGAYVILPRGDNVLLTVQWEDKPDIQLPGGGIDPGEQSLLALHREVLEETGWRIGAPRRMGAFRRFVYMPEYDFWAEKLCHVYVARPVRSVARPTEPDHEPLWLKVDDAMDALRNAGEQLFLDRYRRLGQPL